MSNSGKINPELQSLLQLLSGGDLRSIGASNDIVAAIHDSKDFDTLFACLFHPDRLVVMRTADAVEKISLNHPEWLQPHKAAILGLLQQATNKELKWHLAQLVARILLNDADLHHVWQVLTAWVQDPKESKIVRVNALQTMFELAQKHSSLTADFQQIVFVLKQHHTPSLASRIRKLGV